MKILIITFGQSLADIIRVILSDSSSEATADMMQLTLYFWIFILYVFSDGVTSSFTVLITS